MNWGHDILVIFGGVPGTWNLLWGGVFSCLGFIGALIALYRKHKCHEPRCHRLAKHHVEGTPYTVCRKHHPAIPDKAVKGEIGRAHAQAQRIAVAAARPPLPEPVATPSRRKR